MITIYSTGEDFLKENLSFLNENKYMSVFFVFDAPFIKESTKKNYALKAINDNNKTLLSMRVEPYNLMFYGDKDCLEEMLTFIKDNNYEMDGVLCSTEIGKKLLEIDSDYHLQIAMDFMEAKEMTEESSNEVTSPNENDVDELYECMVNFFIDCGLPDRPTKENIRNTLSNHYIIRMDNKIVSLAKKSPNTEDSMRVAEVYTRPEYRNRGLARKVVNYVKNEIIKSGKIATLNVDQANPISNHLYSSLGFKKVFSQGIYIKK